MAIAHQPDVPEDFQARAKHLAFSELIKSHAHKVVDIKLEDMYVVWFCKTLQNWKALVSTDAISGVYIEVTHNGDAHETYVDLYTKASNRVYYGS